MSEASELSRALAAQMSALAKDLFPAGRRMGSSWRVSWNTRNPHSNNLSIELIGPKAGQWCDHAAGEGGDALKLVAVAQCGGELRPAIAWARKWLGVAPHGPSPAARPAPPVTAARDDEGRRKAAVAIYVNAVPLTPSDPVTSYLFNRGIDLAELGRVPRALRYHRSLYNGEIREALPAMVAAISDAAGQHIATHRTWLAMDHGVWGKAPLQTPKMTLGSYKGGTIRLWRGASGRPLAQAPAGETIVIGEGIETCLSVALACPELRVLAAVAIGNMAQVELPPAIAEVILAADNDAGKEAPKRALQRAVDHFITRGRRVRIAMPDQAGTDWNDVLAA